MTSTQNDHTEPTANASNVAPPFDTILDRLEKIVSKLEDAELPLEESLHAFEEGITLSRQGQGILDEAEHKIEVLLKSGKTQPLDPSESNP